MSEDADESDGSTKPYAPGAASQKPTEALRAVASDRHRLIARTAYYLAERRGFCAGHELEDWLDAQREVDGAGEMPAAGSDTEKTPCK